MARSIGAAKGFGSMTAKVAPGLGRGKPMAPKAGPIATPIAKPMAAAKVTGTAKLAPGISAKPAGRMGGAKSSMTGLRKSGIR